MAKPFLDAGDLLFYTAVSHVQVDDQDSNTVTLHTFSTEETDNPEVK